MATEFKHMRPASVAAGDDVSFSRYIKTKAPAAKLEGKASQPRFDGMGNPSIEAGRSLFHRKGVKSPATMTNLLVSGHNNVKIGRDVRIGKLRGYWLYTLSFEERATCPRSCHHWQDCYGNNMPYAKRIDHTHPLFLRMLETEIDTLMRKALRRPGHPGIIVRLHALGDFYSVAYVRFWQEVLMRHPKLVVFGYTAWAPDSPIGMTVGELIDMFPGRAMMRFSNGGMASRCTVPLISAADCPPGAFVCPEQTGQFDACGKCGACWSTLKNVAFLAH